MSPTQTLTHAKPPTSDKMLITIRHPPTGKENKFRVKGTHSVGRVLTSACAAFELNAEGYVYSLGPLSVLLPPLYELTFYLVWIRQCHFNVVVGGGRSGGVVSVRKRLANEQRRQRWQHVRHRARKVGATHRVLTISMPVSTQKLHAATLAVLSYSRIHAV